MLKRIKATLEGITKEVEDFHPLIETVFHHLPEIENVDYTHGLDEFGADFVLTRHDTTLGGSEYIGIIAKIGAIKQNNIDVERQIEECEMERILQSSNNKVFLNEIWIVSNGNITSNAKQVIHHKYKNKNIKFIDQEKLASLIKQYIPNYGMDVSLKVGEYLNSLKTTIKEIEERTNLLPTSVQSLYIIPSLTKIETTIYKRKKESKRKKTNWKVQEIIEREDFLILEGTMGVGKTKLLLEATKYYSNPEIHNDKKIFPIYVTYKELNEKYKNDPEALIQATLSSHSIKECDFTYLLLIDGIDEVIMKAEERINALSILSERTKSKIKFVITSRSIDDPDLEERISVPVARYEIDPLSTKDIIKFVETICENLNITKRIIQDLKQSQLFKALPRTPIAAIILAKLLNENAEDIPSNMTELYSKYMELSLGRWDISKGLQSQKEFSAMFSVMSDLAVHMLNFALPEITIEEAKSFFDDYLKKRNLGLTVEQLFEQLTNRCDIVTCNKKSGVFAFKHKTFAEYFYAQNLIHRNNVEITEDIFNLYWTNVYFFYVGLKRDCPDLLNSIINVEIKDDLAQFLRIINMGNFLLAAYTSPYETITKGVKTIFNDAVQMYFDITNKKIENPLSGFSQMELLSLFRTILYDSYSYEFFQNAISDALLSIAVEERPDNEKALLLFFLNLAHMDVGGVSLFDHLIEQFGTKLPLPIQLAIAHEADFANNKTTTIKKMEKRIRRGVKNNHGFNDSIKAMYEKSIKDLKIT